MYVQAPGDGFFTAISADVPILGHRPVWVADTHDHPTSITDQPATHDFRLPVTIPIQEIPAGKGEGPVELLSVHVEQAGCGPLVGDQQLFAGQIGPDALDAYPLSICHRGQPGEVGLAAAGIQ